MREVRVRARHGADDADAEDPRAGGEEEAAGQAGPRPREPDPAYPIDC